MIGLFSLFYGVPRENFFTKFTFSMSIKHAEDVIEKLKKKCVQNLFDNETGLHPEM